jgi:hypothetical protein
MLVNHKNFRALFRQRRQEGSDMDLAEVSRLCRYDRLSVSCNKTATISRFSRLCGTSFENLGSRKFYEASKKNKDSVESTTQANVGDLRYCVGSKYGKAGAKE